MVAPKPMIPESSDLEQGMTLGYYRWYDFGVKRSRSQGHKSAKRQSSGWRELCTLSSAQSLSSFIYFYTCTLYTIGLFWVISKMTYDFLCHKFKCAGHWTLLTDSMHCWSIWGMITLLLQLYSCMPPAAWVKSVLTAKLLIFAWFDNWMYFEQLFAACYWAMLCSSKRYCGTDV